MGILFGNQLGYGVLSVPVRKDNNDESYYIRRRADIPPWLDSVRLPVLRVSSRGRQYDDPTSIMSRYP